MNYSRLLYTCFISAIVCYPLIYIGNYAGDSQVYLVYGENAARGAFFEFNLGEKSAGVTSPGYMLLIAAFFKTVPDTWVPVLIKNTNLLFWYGVVVLVFVEAKAITDSIPWAMLGTLAIGLLPGSVYNANNGTENGIFAFFVMAWIVIAIKTHWFESDANKRLTTNRNSYRRFARRRLLGPSGRFHRCLNSIDISRIDLL